MNTTRDPRRARRLVEIEYPSIGTGWVVGRKGGGGNVRRPENELLNKGLGKEKGPNRGVNGDP